MSVLWTLTVGAGSVFRDRHGISTVAVLLSSAVLLLADFLRRPRSKILSWKDAFSLYLLRIRTQLLGFIKWRQFVKDSKRFAEAQQEFVLRQVRANADSAYGRDHGFGSIRSLAEFRRSQPLTTYADVATYVSRVERGEATAMFGDGRQPLMFGCSSGTTGRAKIVPITGRQDQLVLDMIGLLYGAHRKLLAMSPRLNLTTFCAPRWRFTESGVRIGSVMASSFESSRHRRQSTLPDAAMAVADEQAALYVGLLFGLRDAHVAQLYGSFASSLLGMMQCLERQWRALVRDVRTGRLGDHVQVGDDLRHQLNALLTPDPVRADQLEREFSKGFENILRRIFPHLEVIPSLHSGSSMAVYMKRCLFYTGEVPVLSPFYMCLEGLLGVNIRPCSERPGYALIPNATYVEFLPVDNHGTPLEGEQTLQASEVEVGGKYEIVLTNTSGLYRYRLGDVVEVVGFFNQVPLIDFMFRTGQLLNIHFEKMTEASLTSALEAAAGGWDGLRLLDFTTAESVLGPDSGPEPPHYLVFLETEGGTPTEEQRQMIDAVLCEEHYVYKSFRVKNAIGPMMVMSVARGTFAEFREHVISTTQTFLLQFKQPRVLKTSKQVQFFMERSIKEA